MQLFKNRNFLLKACLSSIAATAILTGCEVDPVYSSFDAVEVQSTLLAELVRADGSPIADVVELVEQKYGFRAQTMNFVVPTLNIHLTSSIENKDPKKIASDVEVVAWQTIAESVINDAHVLPFTLSIHGVGPTRCAKGNCRLRTMIDAYAAHFGEQVVAGLEEELELRIMGTDAEGNSVIQALAPTKTEYNCTVDHTKIDQEYGKDYDIAISDAVRCAGKVQFTLE